MSASSHCAPVSGTYSAPLSFSPHRLARAVVWRRQKLQLADLSEGMKRDLGFADGRASPLRDPLRD